MLGLPEPQEQGLSKPSVKQHLAALRMLFDWLVVGHVLDVNSAHAVRGPKYSQKKGKTPVLDRDEARALIGVMIYTFARVGAVLQMNVSDYYSQGRRSWVRLHEKLRKEHEAPCVPKLAAFLMNTCPLPASRRTRTGRCSALRAARPARRWSRKSQTSQPEPGAHRCQVAALLQPGDRLL